jgi:hypothetical protein
MYLVCEGGETDLDALVRRGSGHSGSCAVGVVAAGVGEGPACEIIEMISQSTTLVQRAPGEGLWCYSNDEC